VVPHSRVGDGPYSHGVLSAKGLTKVYDGDRTVVCDVSFELKPGTVTAFLGPNGAGKSTTLRMLTALTPPTRGESWLAGRRYGDWPNPAHLAGVLLDAGAVHPGRTGVSHLRAAASLIGVAARRVEDVLGEVGLSDAAGMKIGHYSLGMRQRLGLAHALLADPPVLILDEPINGLDPVGIRDIRALLRARAASGGTVLVSSHILSEVAQTADSVLIIRSGSLLADGPLAGLLSTHRCVLRGPDLPVLVTTLARAGIRTSQTSDGWLRAEAPCEHVSELAFRARARIHEITEDHLDLEELFFQLSDQQPSGLPADHNHRGGGR
jgi:ABC-2 type transport system ATP-binding protein